MCNGFEIMKQLTEKSKKTALIAYLAVWVICFLAILMSPHDDGGIAFMTMYVVLPIASICVGAVIGYVSHSQKKWLAALFFGAMNMLCAAAFPILNSGFKVKEIVTYYDAADIPMFLFFALAAIIGILFGHIKMKNEKRKNNK